MSHDKNIGQEDSRIEKYILDHSSSQDPILHELFRQTNLTLFHPRRSTDHLSGLFLEMISKMVRPSRILEIGTFSGYGTISLSRGLQDDGLIHSIEINDELEDFILEGFEKAGIKDKVILHIGDALEIIPTIEDSFDLVFIDAEKNQYSEYFDQIIDKVKPGGFILADNVLWSGKVVEDNIPGNDHFTKGILDFNKKVQIDSRVENLLLPVYDGIMVIRKL